MKIKYAFALLSSLALLASCGGTPEVSSSSQSASITYQDKYGDFLFTKTDMKAGFYEEVANKGTVVTEEYDTFAYAYDAKKGNELGTTPIHKRMHIYLPYGYDESKQYDIAYVMHGGGDNENYWLTDELSNVSDNKNGYGKYIRPTLDNMMFNKKCRDVIIVTPTFYSMLPDTDYNTDYAELPKYFPYELENEIIPLIEAKYHTYSDKKTDDASLIASRDHRAFMGLSMGSMTSQRVMCHMPDKISYIGSFSGEMTKEEPDSGYQTIYDSLHSEEFNQYKINYWYNQNGTMDMAHDPHEKLCQDVLAKMGDKFVDAENFAWVDIKGGAHAFNVWWVGLYNSLQLFFPVSK